MEKKEVKRVVVSGDTCGQNCAAMYLDRYVECKKYPPGCDGCPFDAVNPRNEDFNVGDILILYDDGSVELQKAN